MRVDFEWEAVKADANARKHRVGFEEALTVFADPLARIFDDSDYSAREQREIIVGHFTQQRLLLVSFTERDVRIRIINARAATKRERHDYEHHTESLQRIRWSADRIRPGLWSEPSKPIRIPDEWHDAGRCPGTRCREGLRLVGSGEPSAPLGNFGAAEPPFPECLREIMTRSGLTTIPPVRPPFRSDRRFALHVLSRARRRDRGNMRGFAARRDRAERLASPSQPLHGYVGRRRAHRGRGGNSAIRMPRDLEQERPAAEATMNRDLAELGCA